MISALSLSLLLNQPESNNAKVTEVKFLKCRLDATVESYNVIHLQNHTSKLNKKDRSGNVKELHSNGFLNNFLFCPEKDKELFPDQPVHVDIKGI